MPKVEFIKPWTVKQGDGKGPVYKIGDVVDLERSYADKYKRRGLAVDYAEKPKPAPKVEAPAPQPGSAADVAPHLIQETSAQKPTAFRRK